MCDNCCTRAEKTLVAVIVNDMSELNIDAGLVLKDVTLKREEERLVELSNGCICCTLRDDLIDSIKELAAAGKYDYCLIESTGISEPMPVASTFDHSLLGEVARLDTLVTVVDSGAFLDDFGDGSCLKDSKDLGADDSADEEDERTIAHLLADQVECANVIVLIKASTLDRGDLDELRSIIAKMAPMAKVVEADYGKVDPKAILDTGLFDLTEYETMPGWLQELAGIGHASETEEYGITSFIYRASRPFHPDRLDRAFESKLPGVLRAKGTAWLAFMHQSSLRINLAGGAMTLEEGSDWTDEKDGYGNRCQEIVIIGAKMREALVRRRLDAALLTDDEFKAGLPLWKQWGDDYLA